MTDFSCLVELFLHVGVKRSQCVFTCVYACFCACVHVCVFVCIRVSGCVCMFVCLPSLLLCRNDVISLKYALLINVDVIYDISHISSNSNCSTMCFTAAALAVRDSC